MAFFEGNPKSAKGALGWIGLAAVASMLALLVGTMAPGLIPTRATQSNL